MHRVQRIFLLVCLTFFCWQAGAVAAPAHISDMNIYEFTQAVERLAAQEDAPTYFSDYRHLTPTGRKDGDFDVYPLDYNDGTHRAVILYSARDTDSPIEHITLLWEKGDETAMNNVADLGDLMGSVIGLTEEESDVMTSQGNDASGWCKAAHRRIRAELVQSDTAYGIFLTAEDR